MLLEIFNKRFELIGSVDYESSSYDNEKMRLMAESGYSFRLNHVWVLIGKGNILEKLADIKDQLEVIKKFNDQSLEEILKDLTSDSYEVGDAAQALPASDHTVEMIECIETGKFYSKQSHAARDLGIDPSAVSDSIKTGRPRKGYTFRKVLV